MQGMGDVEIEGTPFQVLMQQACKLKTHQGKIDRLKFDKWPKFYQNTVYVKEDQQAERRLPFAERMEIARRYKAKADLFLKAGVDPLQAALNYEWSSGMFKWARNVDPEWRKKAVDDDSIVEETYSGENDEEVESIFALKLSCLLNLSRCYYKQREFKTAREACDWALELQPTSDKALLLRARAFVAPASRGSTERDLAIVDLEKAMLLLLDNNGQESDDLSRRRRETSALLSDLKREMKAGKEADRKYSGLFKRGEVYDADEKARRAKLANEKKAEDEKTPVQPEAEIAAAERLLREYDLDPSRDAESAELRRGIETAKGQLERRRKPPDFRNPTVEMIKDAAERGIDLRDPQVLEMLEDLAEERVSGDPIGADRERVEEAESLSLRELMRRLTTLGVAHDHCESKNDLVALYLSSSEEEEPPKEQPKETPKEPVRTWRYTLAIATLLVLYRLWTMDLLMPLLATFFGLPYDEKQGPLVNDEPAPSDNTPVLEYYHDEAADEWEGGAL